MRELFLLDGDAEELGWQERALCAQTDPEAFFPEKGGSAREAKKVCLTCDVRNDCLEYALMNDERFGIWGGLSERSGGAEEARRLSIEAAVTLPRTARGSIAVMTGARRTSPAARPAGPAGSRQSCQP